jgi:hypothetical protein
VLQRDHDTKYANVVPHYRSRDLILQQTRSRTRTVSRKNGKILPTSPSQIQMRFLDLRNSVQNAVSANGLFPISPQTVSPR